jgi:capsular polysaccharide biosynthesis protein
VKRILDGFSRRTWAVVLVFALVGAGTGLLRMHLKEYSYTATATVYVTPPVSSSAGDALTADQYAANRTQLYLSLIASPELARAVIDRLKINQSPGDLTDRLKAKATPLTSLLSITASGTSPTDAGNLATAYAETLPSFAKSIEGSGGLRGAPSVVTVALPVAKDPSFIQRYGLLIALIVAAGLMGFLYSFAYQRRFPNVRTTDQLRRELHIALAEKVNVKKPEPQLRRLQAELLTDPHGDGCLMIVGARSKDRAETFSELLSQSIQERDSVRSNGMLIVDVPALLESSASAGALHRSDCEHALLITRYNVTSMRDVRQVRDLLTMNNVAVRGAIILRRSRSRRNSTPRDQPVTGPDDLEFPWPTIDVLEAEKQGRTVRAD